MNGTMHAAVARKYGQPLTIETVPVPIPGPGEVLIRVAACGVCRSDLDAVCGHRTNFSDLPFTPGHECVGTVVEVGHGVVDWREGDRIGVACPHTCSATGGFAEFVLSSTAFVAPIPDRLGFLDAAPIFCAGVTAFKGVQRSGVKPGGWLVISGIGGVGHLAVQYARAMGIRVIAIDTSDDKLNLARALGAEIAICASDHDPVIEIERRICQADAALSASGNQRGHIQAAAMVRSGGQCVVVGLPDRQSDVELLVHAANDVHICPLYCASHEDLAEALSYAESCQVRASIEMQPLQAINDVFARIENGDVKGRVVITMN